MIKGKTTTPKTTSKDAAVKSKTVKKETKKEDTPKKPVVAKQEKKETEQKATIQTKRIKGTPKYFEAVGRRKTSTARIRLFTQDKKDIVVNKKPYKDYFPVFSLQKVVEAPLEQINSLGKFGISAHVKGGGPSGQAEACRHGIARALVVLNPYFRKRLKKAGFLTRDPRVRERKKPGLKRARRAPQWSKR